MLTKDTLILVNRIKNGDREAFKCLIEANEKLVGHIVFRMIPNTHDQEDICQDVFLKVFKNLNTFRFESKLSTWIARITYRTCLNYLQKKKPLLFDDNSAEGQNLDSMSDTQYKLDEIIEQKDINERLQIEMNRIDIKYRTILTLFHLEDMSYTEIAAVLDIPEGTVKSHLFRARKSLKDKISAKYKREELWNENI